MTRSILYLFIFVLILSCQNKEANNHESENKKVFLELWNAFDKNYAFFELRNVDWKKEKNLFLNTTNFNVKDSVFFDKMCNLLKKFGDTHINLESDSLKLYCNAGDTPEFFKNFPSNESFGQFIKARNSTLKKLKVDSLSTSKSGIFEYGISTSQRWGYLRIKRFYGAPLKEIQTELDEIDKKLQLAENKIVDIRVNPGGNDETALLCAGYDFHKKEIAFIKKVRNGNDYEDFSIPDTTYVYPKTSFRREGKPIYLLTNRAAGSSADVYALTMSNLHNVKIIGTNTEGIFSDMHRMTLSNGWNLTLSNERYYSKEMKCYEGIGVPVDEKALNTMEDALKEIDMVIEKVIELNAN